MRQGRQELRFQMVGVLGFFKKTGIFQDEGGKLRNAAGNTLLLEGARFSSVTEPRRQRPTIFPPCRSAIYRT